MADTRMHDRRGEFSNLIVAVGQHDRAAFATLFSYFAPRIKAMMMKTGLPDQRAEDVAQEAMLLVWRKAALFDPAGAGPSAWIYTIARNARIDALRREQRTQRIENEALLEPETFSPSADLLLISSQSEELARASLARLSDDQKTVVTMSFFEDRPHSEIAEVLGIPLGTVKSRLRLAIKRLRSLLEEPQ